MAEQTSGKLSILLELVNRASPQLDRFTKDFRDAATKIEGASKDMASSTNTTTRTIGARIGAVRGVLTGLAGAAVAAGAAIAAALQQVNTIRMDSALAEQFGLTINQAEAVRTSLERIGASASDVTGVFADVATALRDALKDPDSDEGQAFRRLGIDIKDAQGNLRDYREVAVEAARAVTEAQKAGALAGEQLVDAQMLLGEQALADSQALLTYQAAIEKANQRTAEGIGISEDAIEASRRLGAAQDALSAAVSDVGGKLVELIVPAFTNLLEALYNSYLNGGLVARVFETITGVGQVTGVLIKGLTAGFIYFDLAVATASTTSEYFIDVLKILYNAATELDFTGVGDKLADAWGKAARKIENHANGARAVLKEVFTIPTISGQPAIATSTPGVSDQINQYNELARREREAVEARKKAAEQAKKAAEEAKRQAEAAAKLYADAQQNLLDQIAALQQLTTEEQTLSKIREGAYGKLSTAQQQVLLGYARQVDSLRRLKLESDAFATSYLSMADSIIQAGKNLGEATARFQLIQGGMTSRAADALITARAPVVQYQLDLQRINLQIDTYQKIQAASSGEARKFYQLQIQQLEAQRIGLTKAFEAIQLTELGTAAIATQIGNAAQATEVWSRYVSDARQQFADLEAAESLVVNALMEGTISAEEFAAAIDKIRADRIDLVASRLTYFEQQLADAGRQIQSTLGDSLYEVMQGNFGNILTSFKQMLDRMVAQALAANIARAIFGEQFTSTGRMSGAGGNALSSLFSFFGFGRREGGGPVTAGQPYIVGEKRPELFVPTSNGTIIPNLDMVAKIGGGGSSSNVQLNVTVQALDSKDVLANMDKIKRPLAEMLSGASRQYNLGSR